MSSRPNILVIMSDEHDPAVSRCYGDPIVETPNLDALAARGVLFDACYTNSPLCVPARLSLTAGKYVSRVGAWNNECRLASDDIPSLPRRLGESGYESILIGKQHYDRTHRYGFTCLSEHLGHNNGTMRGRGERRAADDFRVHEKLWKDRSAKFYPAEKGGILDHDREATRIACEFLSQRNAEDQPFFTFVGLLAPHFPLIVPEAIAAKYRGRVPMPEIPPGMLEQLPRNYRHERAGFGVPLADEAITRSGRELYWALCEWMDGQVGQILDTLAANPAIAENTIIVYTADHGENKGDHGLWWKNCMYEHSARVPLIVSWPARWAGGQRRSGVCSHVDLVQTLMAIGEADTPSDWDGDSLLPMLDDQRAPWKDSAVSEYYSHPICSGFQMLRQGEWKYVYHTIPDSEHGPERELYHLPTDPKEFTNLAGDPAHAERITAMHAGLVAELGEDLDAIEQRCRADFARGYGPQEQRTVAANVS